MNELGAVLRLKAGLERRAVRALLANDALRRHLARRRRDPVEGRVLAEDVAALLGLDDIDGRSQLSRYRPARARAVLAESIAITDRTPPLGVTHVNRRVHGRSGEIPARVYEPRELARPSAGLVYLHGGGWVTGSVATHDSLCRHIALGARCRVVAAEYRLAPEHPFPAAVDDCVEATRWALTNAEELGLDPARVGVAGDSAGANLSAVVALETRNDARRPALQALLYPALDATCALPSHALLGTRYFLTSSMCDWYYTHYLGTHDRRDGKVSPLLGATTTDIPALIYTAGFDPLRDEGKAYADRLAGAGTRVHHHEFTDSVHGFMLMGGALSSARKAVDIVIADIGRALQS